MSAADDAQWFLDQLRAQSEAALRTPSVADSLVADKLIDHELEPEERERIEREARQIFDRYAEGMARTQRNIEKTAATTFMAADLGQRPLVGYLRTGQTHAVCVLGTRRSDGQPAVARTASALRATVRSMRMPLHVSKSSPRMSLRAWASFVGDHWRKAVEPRPYLILFEEQLPLFIEQICGIVARSLPAHPAEPGKLSFKFSVPDVTDWIAGHPEIGGFFTDLIAGYAVKGRIRPDITLYRTMAANHRRFAELLRESVRHFILSHEYAHIMLGHLNTTATRRGVLPAADAESLDYSRVQEAVADSVGTMLAINACVDHAKLNHSLAFLGIALYLDVMDAMDRAVALLETGNENVRQVGSHPPAVQRKRNIRHTLSMMADASGADVTGRNLRMALDVEEIQAEIIGLLWAQARPVLLDLRQRGARPSTTWLIVPTETASAAAPPPQSPAPQPKPPASTEFVPTSFLVSEVWDLPGRDGLMVSGKTVEGKLRSGMSLRDEAGQVVRVLSLEFLSPRDRALGEVTIMLERTDPSPARRGALLTAAPREQRPGDQRG